jgi:hypothetical protein
MRVGLAALVVVAMVWDFAWSIERVARAPGLTPERVAQALRSDPGLVVRPIRLHPGRLECSRASGSWKATVEVESDRVSVEVSGMREMDADGRMLLDEICAILSSRIPELGEWREPPRRGRSTTIGAVLILGAMAVLTLVPIVFLVRALRRRRFRRGAPAPLPPDDFA